MSVEYKTNSRSKIMRYLEANAYKAVSVSDISDYLEKDGNPVNDTTIYRYLDKLEREDLLMKYVAASGGKATYQLKDTSQNCDEHLHLKCMNCGRVLHMDCDFMSEISKHIRDEHDFKVSYKSSIIYGYCSDCVDEK